MITTAVSVQSPGGGCPHYPPGKVSVDTHTYTYYTSKRSPNESDSTISGKQTRGTSSGESHRLDYIHNPVGGVGDSVVAKTTTMAWSDYSSSSSSSSSHCHGEKGRCKGGGVDPGSTLSSLPLALAVTPPARAAQAQGRLGRYGDGEGQVQGGQDVHLAELTPRTTSNNAGNG